MTAVKHAMKQKAAIRLATLLLINAAIKDKEIASRVNGETQTISEADILAILGKMVIDFVRRLRLQPCSYRVPVMPVIKIYLST